MRRVSPSKAFTKAVLSLVVLSSIFGPALAEAAKHPLSAKDEFAVGQLYFFNSDFPQAIDHFTKAIKADPNNGQYYFERGHAYFRLDDYIQAVPDYSRSIQLKFKPSLNYERRAFCYLDSKQYKKGIDDCSEAINFDPRSRIAYLNREKAYSLIHEVEKAKQDKETIKKLDKNPRPKDLCDRCQLTHMPNEKIALCQRALEIDPKYTQALIMLGATYLDLNKRKEALDAFNKLIALEPDNLTAVIDRGLCYLEINNFEDGIKDLTFVLAKAPNCFQALYWRGDCYRGLGQHKDALADYKQAIDLIKADMASPYAKRSSEYRNALGKFMVSAYRGSAHSHEKIGDLKQAIDDMTLAVNESRMAPHDLAELLPERADLYKKAGRDEDQHRDLLEAKAVIDKLEALRHGPIIPRPKMHPPADQGNGKNQQAPGQIPTEGQMPD